MANKF